MTYYSKSLQDYIRIPILLKNITQISQKSSAKLTKLLYYKYYPLVIDERYIRISSNPNTDILKERQHMTQKLYFICEDFNNEWPEFEVNYKARYALGIIDQTAQQKQIEEALIKIKNQSSIKLIGVINMGSSTLENLFKKENMIKVPELSEEQFLHFIEPWLYNCLSLIQSQICNTISQLKKDDESNRTIVFNRLEQKFDQKIMKKKKKYRCIKLCGDHHLMLHLYQEAFNYFNEAEEMLKKIDDYLWILGCLQGKLACVIISPQINLSSREDYIEELIDETYSIAKKTKNWNFECQNYFKIAKLHVDQPEKIDELMRNFLTNYSKNISQDQRFLLYTTIGSLYERCGFNRKRNYFYFLAAMIHINKKTEVSSLLLIQIQKAHSIKEWSYLYKKVLQLIIQQQEILNDNEYFLELLSKCAHNLSEKQISDILSQLNFNNNEIVHLDQLQFLQLKEFYAIQSQIKPKQNRIGNRESPRKVGAGFFMSWKRQENLLFQENEDITIKGSITNKIAFPIRVKITFNIHSFSDRPIVCSKEQTCMYLQPSTVHKFETKIKAKGATEQLWVIDKLTISMWNFESQISLSSPIKYQIYEQQPQIELDLQKQLHFQQSCNLFLESQLKIKNFNVPFCLIKLNISVYYIIDVGFQQNQVILRDTENFMDVDFKNSKNIRIYQSRTNDSVQYKVQNGVLDIRLKKLKVHRRNVSRIEFTLEYIRGLNTKFQISKQYIRKCNFYSKFSYQIEGISTPIIDKYYKDSVEGLKIIEDHYKLRLKVSKNDISDLKSYVLTYNGINYLFSNANQIIIEQTKQKFDAKSAQKQFKQLLAWQCESTKLKGQIQTTIPIIDLMRKSSKSVMVKVQENIASSHKKIIVEYEITSAQPTCLSHHVVLNPIDIQIDRMYALRGKTRFEQTGMALSNKFECIFGSKSKNSYQIGIVFTDGWIYWYDGLIHVNKS